MRLKTVLLLTILAIASSSIAQNNWQKTYPITSGYYTSFDGTKIYYETRGEGKPVLLIHGFIVNSNSWKHSVLYKKLLSNGYKVVLLDMRGNGKSDKPKNEMAYANDAEAKDIVGLMRFLKIKEYSLVGYSRGAIIATRVLLRDKAVKVACIGGMDTSFTNPDWPRRIQIYHALIGDNTKGFEGLVKYVEKEGFGKKILAYLQKYQPSCTINELRSIKQPILVLKGTKDNYNLSAPQLAQLFSNGSYATTPGNHDQAASTAIFAQYVIQFFKKHHY